MHTFEKYISFVRLSKRAMVTHSNEIVGYKSTALDLNQRQRDKSHKKAFLLCQYLGHPVGSPAAPKPHGSSRFGLIKLAAYVGRHRVRAHTLVPLK